MPGRSLDASITLPFVPGSGASGSRGHRHETTEDGHALVLPGVEAGPPMVYFMKSQYRAAGSRYNKSVRIYLTDLSADLIS